MLKPSHLWEDFRIGTGLDVHALVVGRPLILGGIEIPFEKGLEGHSDADALLHAIMDALLGALALGDIGDHFPNTDPQYKGANSLQLLTVVHALIQNAGFQIGNIDSTLVAQRPKLKPYLPAMQLKIAECLNLPPGLISIKATTTEQLGFTGREEGIVAQAIVLLRRSSES